MMSLHVCIMLKNRYDTITMTCVSSMCAMCFCVVEQINAKLKHYRVIYVCGTVN